MYSKKEGNMKGLLCSTMQLTKYIRKEVKNMKSICALVIAAALVFTGSYALAADPITDFSQTIHVTTRFNAFGMAIGQTTVTDTVTTTTGEDGTTSTTHTVTTTEAKWIAGSLKTTTSHTRSDTTNSDGSTSWSEYTDTYSYDSNGCLVGCSGTGSWGSNDPETGQSSGGTITRTFEIRNGQALLMSQVTSGTIYDANGVAIGTTNTTTTYTYEYLGGQWVVASETSTTHTEMFGGDNDPSAPPRYEETITRVTTYERNASGQVTGLSQTASGTRIIRDAIGPDGTPSEMVFHMENYSATASFHPALGWYISEESYDWVLDTNWDAWGDPAATGVVYQGADGQWYMNVTVWSDASHTETENITIKLNLDGLSTAEREAMISILTQYAESGEALTLYGISQGGVLSQGATLYVVGLGNGSFDNHPFDYQGDVPDVLADQGWQNEDFAQFVAMMQGSGYFNQVFAGMSQADIYDTLDQLYTALVSGEFDIGESLTINGITFSLVAENLGRSGGAGARLVANVNGKTYNMRHLTHAVSSQLGLVGNEQLQGLFDAIASGSNAAVMDWLLNN